MYHWHGLCGTQTYKCTWNTHKLLGSNLYEIYIYMYIREVQQNDVMFKPPWIRTHLHRYIHIYFGSIQPIGHRSKIIGTGKIRHDVFHKPEINPNFSYHIMWNFYMLVPRNYKIKPTFLGTCTTKQTCWSSCRGPKETSARLWRRSCPKSSCCSSFSTKKTTSSSKTWVTIRLKNAIILCLKRCTSLFSPKFNHYDLFDNKIRILD